MFARNTGTLDDGHKPWEITEAGGPTFKSVEIDSANSPRDDARPSKADPYKGLTPLSSPSAVRKCGRHVNERMSYMKYYPIKCAQHESASSVTFVNDGALLFVSMFLKP